MKESIASFDIQLTGEERDQIESVARPLPIYPYWHRAMSAPDMASPSEIAYLNGYRKSMGIDE